MLRNTIGVTHNTLGWVSFVKYWGIVLTLEYFFCFRLVFIVYVSWLLMDYLRWVFISTNSFFEICRVTVLNGQICMVKFVRPKDNVCVWKHLDCASWTKTRKITTAKTWTVPDNFQRLINKFLGDLKKSGTFALKLYSSCVCFFRQAPALFIYTRQNKSSWKVLFTQRTFWCVPKHASQIYLSQGKNTLVRISLCCITRDKRGVSV